MGIEPTRAYGSQDFLTTITFVTISVCSLDFLFTIYFYLGVCH